MVSVSAQPMVAVTRPGVNYQYAPMASSAGYHSIPYHQLGGPGDQLTPGECTAFGVPQGSSWCSGPGFTPAGVRAVGYGSAPAVAGYGGVATVGSPNTSFAPAPAYGHSDSDYRD